VIRRAGRKFLPFLPLAVLASLCVVVALAISSCGGDVKPVWPTEPETIVPPKGAPTVRVLLTPSQVETAILEPGRGGHFLVDGRELAASQSAGLRVQVTRAGRTWRLNNLDTQGDVIVLEAAAGGYCKFNDVAYRGTFVLHPQGATGFVVINHVNMETYLAGVLARELYTTWAPETYRALAVTSRTFALYHKEHFGAAHDYDVGDNQSAQVYGGVAAESSKSWKAVRDTLGLVLAYGRPGREQIFMAQYSACSGGVVNGAYVIRDAERIPPLEGGQIDEDGSRCSHWRWDTVKITKADMYNAIRSTSYPAAAAMTNVKTIRVASETPYGRMIWVDLLDSAGHSIRLRAEDLRLVLLRSGPKAAKSLYSMNCHIREVATPDGGAFEFYDGRGFGHGVGLSQWGAEDKAQRGMKAEQILQFYYPGAVLIRKY
jgi:stage II sporulation protein D